MPRTVEPQDPDNPLVTAEELQKVVPSLPDEKATQYAQAMSKAAAMYGINTPQRISLWVAQMAWESDRFRTFVEYASGRAYEGREDLGNVNVGDGPRFKGRGWIQTTGRANYEELAAEFGMTLEETIAWLQTPLGAAISAAHYWATHGCNELADAGDVKAITRKINGGYSHLTERIALSETAQEVFA